MQHPVMRLRYLVTAGGFFVLCLGIFLIKISKANEFKYSPMASHFQRGKIGTAFSHQYKLDWVDSQQGVARIQLQLFPRNFSPTHWTYRWILPKGVTTKHLMESHFTTQSMKEELSFSFAVEGLSPQKNQNIIFELMPVGRQVGGMSVVIPSLPEQTQEGQIIKESQSSPFIPKSFTFEPNKIPEGIRF